MTDATLDLEYTPFELPVPAMVRASELDAMRKDIYLLCGYLDAIQDGMTVQELASLADVAAEVRGRWGLEA